MTIAVLGATGHLGGLVVEALRARGADVLALGRNAARLEELAATGVRTGTVDYGDRDQIASALVGVDAALLISGNAVGQRIEQHRNVVEAAVAAGVGRLAYTSALQARTSPLILAAEHKATEEIIEAAGIPATILRNGWYTENYADEFARARETGVIANSIGGGRISSATRAELAEAAAVVLSEDGHVGEVYELGGDEAWSFADFAAAAQEALGTPVSYIPLTPEQEQEALRGAGLDEGTVGFVSALNSGLRDDLQVEEGGALSRLIGRPTARLADTLRSWA